MTRDQVLEGIIEGYRDSIRVRYQYDTIKRKYDIPDSIDEETVNILRDYFLNSIYPAYAKRAELNDAFKSLDGYIKNPQKLFRILFDAYRLVFTYGRHLPKILNAGLKAMKSFRVAAKFENILVNEALKNEIQAPFDLDKINALIQLIPKRDIDKFIDISQSLFETLHDRLLVQKIKEIITYLIEMMKKNPEDYSSIEINGLEAGLEILEEGDQLFNRLTEEDQHNLVYLITEIEKDNLL